MDVFKIPVEHNGCNIVPVINNTVDCSFKRGGEMVMFKIAVECCSDCRNNTVDCSFKRGGEMVVFKIPVELNGGNVVPTVETIL